MITRISRLFVTTFLGVFALHSSHASSLFEITITGPNGTTAGSSSLSKLLGNAVRATGAFSESAGVMNYDIKVDYAGVADALTLNVSTVVTSYTNFMDPGFVIVTTTSYAVTGPGGYSVTSSNRDDLAQSVVDDVKVGSELLPRSIIARSLIAVTDGNPAATTSLLADQTFHEFAFPHSDPSEARQGAGNMPASSQSSIRVTPDIGFIHAGSFRGTSYTLPLSYRRRLTERVRLAFHLPFNYTEIAGAEVYRAGLIAGMPVRLLSLDTNQNWWWQITPSVGTVGGLSSDLEDGGLVWQGAFSSALAYDFKFCRLAMGNHVSCYETESISGYNSRVSQQILKNGLKLEAAIVGPLSMEFWGIHSYFVQTAAVRNYFTVGGGLVCRRPSKRDGSRWNGSLILGLYSHIGDDYTSPHIRFGTEWKF